jgi:hypothetical protein
LHIRVVTEISLHDKFLAGLLADYDLEEAPRLGAKK